MNSTAEVVIVGAGVIGCSTAYHLTKMGLTDVAVVEMEQVGAGSSSKSASMLSLQFGHDALLARMAQYSYQRYMGFEEELGTTIDFRKTGWLSVASGSKAKELRQHAEMLNSLGIRTEVLPEGLDPIREDEEATNPARFVGGSLVTLLYMAQMAAEDAD